MGPSEDGSDPDGGPDSYHGGDGPGSGSGAGPGSDSESQPNSSSNRRSYGRGSRQPKERKGGQEESQEQSQEQAEVPVSDRAQIDSDSLVPSQYEGGGMQNEDGAPNSEGGPQGTGQQNASLPQQQEQPNSGNAPEEEEKVPLEPGAEFGPTSLMDNFASNVGTSKQSPKLNLSSQSQTQDAVQMRNTPNSATHSSVGRLTG